MRPNSLFFDRSGGKSLARAVSVSLTVLFLVLLGYMLIRYKHFAYLLRTELLLTPMFGWLLLGYGSVAVLSVVVIRRINCRVRRHPVLWTGFVFLVAFLMRGFVLLALQASALGGGQEKIQLQILFLPQNMPSLLLCVLGALSCAAVYWIARFVDDGSAGAAGLMFALYPAGIFASREQLSLQISLLFVLLAVLFALAAFSAQRRVSAVVMASLSAGSLALCAVALETFWLVVLAFAAVWVVLFVGSIACKNVPQRLIFTILAFCAVFFSVRGLTLDLPGWGPLDQNLSGAVSAGAAQQAREGEAILDQLNWDTLQKGYAVQGAPIRLDQSVTNLWLEKDAALGHTIEAPLFRNSALRPLGEAIRLMDFFFVAGVLLFAWIGALLRRSGGAGDLLLWLLLLWVGAHLFSDRQTMTRVLGMPLLIIFAANGVFSLTGTEPRPTEKNKYDACLHHGALNLGDFPPREESGACPEAFHPASSGAGSTKASGLYAAMEADLGKQAPHETHNKHTIETIGEKT